MTLFHQRCSRKNRRKQASRSSSQPCTRLLWDSVPQWPTPHQQKHLRNHWAKQSHQASRSQQALTPTTSTSVREYLNKRMMYGSRFTCLCWKREQMATFGCPATAKHWSRWTMRSSTVVSHWLCAGRHGPCLSRIASESHLSCMSTTSHTPTQRKNHLTQLIAKRSDNLLRLTSQERSLISIVCSNR